MWHHAKHVFGGIGNAGDVVEGPVGVGLVGDISVCIAVSEEHLSVRFNVCQGLFIAVETTFTMGDGHTKYLVGIDFTGGDQMGVACFEVNIFAVKLHVGVAQEGAGQQATFAQNLESVADTQDKTTVLGVIGYGGHDGRQLGDGTRTQVISVGETAGHKNVGTTLQVSVFVPKFEHGFTCVRL